MSKNIVICCDGTGNEFGDRNSNVVRLYQVLVRNETQHVLYYHPGVGTMGAKNALTSASKTWTKVRGLAFGYGLSENIADAYQCLMHAYEPNDHIYMFGFSRGAYTARALCGMLQTFGLLQPGNEGLIPYAIRLFKRNEGFIGHLVSRFLARPSKFQTAAAFKHTFCVDCKPHFLGLWDTVSSIGWILDPFGSKPGRLPHTRDLDDVAIIRHAISIDERRAFFRQNLVDEPKGSNRKQVWFAGVHSDVGGSYPEVESGLSKISLRWMLREADAAGLQMDPKQVADVLGENPAHVKPWPNAELHNSLKPAWYLGEFWPKRTKKRVTAPGVEPAKFEGRTRMNLFRRRFIADGACLHASVGERMKLVSDYRPGNLPKLSTTEPDPDQIPYPQRLDVGRSMLVGVHAQAEWNDTALAVKTGEAYHFDAAGTWHDASIPATAAGYASPSGFFRATERFRRQPDENWFALIGALDRRKESQFLIGAARDWTAPAEGVLFCFANDLRGFYGNNSGFVKMTIKRTS